MKKNPKYHVFANPRGGWSVKKEGASRATVVVKNQEEAIARAKSISKIARLDMVVHKKDGSVLMKIANPTLHKGSSMQVSKKIVDSVIHRTTSMKGKKR